MTIPGNAQFQLDAYLAELGKHLCSLSPDDAKDIVEEIRSHILDKVALAGGGASPQTGTIEDVLNSLGTPAQLASRYLADDLLARAQVSRSPFLIIAGLVRWATLSIVGGFVLIGSLIGYFISVALVWCAVLKPLHPRSAGLWRIPAEGDTSISLRLGFASPPPGAVDLLGWWIVPLGLVFGFGLFFVITRLCAWSIRYFRNSRPLLALRVRKAA